MAVPTLLIRQLRYQRGAVGTEGAFALNIEELALQPGETVGVVGPSGCGKSTLIDLLALLRRPTSVDTFQLLDRDVASLWRRNATDACTDLRARHIGVVLQTGGLLNSVTARENVMLSQRLLGRVDASWVDTLFDALDLAALGHRRPAQLSIGQRQRVAVARALAHRPALVLADEPTASLGIDHAPGALDLLLGLASTSGAAMVIVSHDTELLRERGVRLRHCVARNGMVELAQ
ncbi:ABC transporter ATP-binding protein [Variovorax rhizosphaerae]|uniref:ATP-binding cassette domain-containing protein n=1 Tax=Variovorax rhizosphaerae TaxID=1836200 RepID=A0ABU8WSS8_9BURK